MLLPLAWEEGEDVGNRRGTQGRAVASWGWRLSVTVRKERLLHSKISSVRCPWGTAIVS